MDQIREEDRKDLFEGDADWIEAGRKGAEELNRTGLWVWRGEIVGDRMNRKAAPIAEGEIIEQAKEEAFLAWGL